MLEISFALSPIYVLRTFNHHRFLLSHFLDLILCLARLAIRYLDVGYHSLKVNSQDLRRKPNL